jgi:hypothetical protein
MSATTESTPESKVTAAAAAARSASSKAFRARRIVECNAAMRALLDALQLPIGCRA